MLVYLGGPIDSVSGEYQNWKNECKETFKEYGISCIDPAGTFTYAKSENARDRKETAQKLIKINEHNLLNSDVAIIRLSRNVSSIGTPIELLFCKENGIPHVVIFDGQIEDLLPAYIEGIADVVVYSLRDGIEWVINFVADELNRIR
jgi:hypothetical protein